MTTAPSLSIGEFSRATLLSARQLRDYHEAGLLVPDRVDASSGYRSYRVDQINDAILIRRMRELGVALTRIRTVVAEDDATARLGLVTEELDVVGRDLARRTTVLDTIRELTGTSTTPPVTVRELGPTPALLVSGRSDLESIGAWCDQAFGLLGAHLAAVGAEPAGPGSAAYTDAFYADDSGAVSAWIPVARELPGTDDVACTIVPGGRFAVVVHRGDLADYDLSYGLLGGWVATHAESLPDAAIREHYLIGPADTPTPEDWRSEICWPITPKGITP